MSTDKTVPVRVNKEVLQRAKDLASQFKRTLPTQWIVEMAIADYCDRAEKEGVDFIVRKKEVAGLSSSVIADASVVKNGEINKKKKCRLGDRMHCPVKTYKAS